MNIKFNFFISIYFFVFLEYYLRLPDDDELEELLDEPPLEELLLVELDDLDTVPELLLVEGVDTEPELLLYPLDLLVLPGDV